MMCERCWGRAYLIAQGGGHRSQSDCYRVALDEVDARDRARGHKAGTECAVVALLSFAHELCDWERVRICPGCDCPFSDCDCWPAGRV